MVPEAGLEISRCELWILRGDAVMCIKPAWIFALIEVGRSMVNSVGTPVPAPNSTSFVTSCHVRQEGGGGWFVAMGGNRYNGSGPENFEANGAIESGFPAQG